MREIEAGIEAQRHDAGRGLGRADAGEQAEDAARIHTNRSIAGGQRIDAVKVLALNPEVKFARSIGSSTAVLPHGDDDDLHGNAGGLSQKRERGKKETTKAECQTTTAHMDS